MDNAYRGERIIKELGTRYLPATSGQVADGAGTDSTSKGHKDYLAYKLRAVFPDFVKDGIEAMLGVMHSKPPTILLPEGMEPLRDAVTATGESMTQLLRDINKAQLKESRYGMLVDVEDGGELPYIATYVARTIINWDDGRRGVPLRQTLNLVVLDESEPRRTNEFEWEEEDQFRVLILGQPEENETEGVYRVGVFDEDSSFNEEALTTPNIKGRFPKQIPFVFVNHADLQPDPSEPILLGLSRLSFAVYRLEADYRQSLFMQGQDTLVIVGSAEDEAVRTGAGATLDLPVGGDAKYIGVSSLGIPEQRRALENDRLKAGMFAGRLADNRGTDRESGEAMKTRISAVTATLNTISLTGALALQSVLRIMAEWMGANPEEVIVTPNMDFSDAGTDGQTLVAIIQAKTMGIPLSQKSIHDWMRRKDLTDKTLEEELALIATEKPLGNGAEESEEEEPFVTDVS